MRKLWIIIILLLLVSCTVLDQSSEEDIVDEIIKIEKEIELVDDMEREDVKKGIPSPLSGLYKEEAKVNRRPVAVMFDNHPNARWQSGLSQAEVIYEFLVEAPYTRYMGIFLINDPISLGPIRSARPYFVTTLLEYDPLYVRVGGSVQAKKDILDLQIADIDALSSSNKVFWREKNLGKKAPHNTYTSMEAIRETQKEKNYREKAKFEGFKFHEEDMDLYGDRAEEIIINYFTNNQTKYIYDPAEKVYRRFKDGKKHIDEYDNTDIVAKNIIIQEVPTRLIDSEGRLSMDLIGEGEGKYITNGKAIDINWVKKSKHSKTRFYDENGIEIVLNPGITWIQVVNTNTNIEIQ